VEIGKNDMKLAMTLTLAGSDHSKFLRQIFVSMDITAPDYWFKEFDTYKVGTVANSSSTMHKLGTRLLTKDDFSFDFIDENRDDMIGDLNAVIRQYQHYKESDEELAKEYWRYLIQNLPMSFNYLRTCTMNYAVLRNMYHSRKNHKLVEWHEFCRMIESLPYSELITTPSK
jgi:hypothetical protein